MNNPIIILLSRQSLTHLFGKIGPLLSSKCTVIHVAYCKEEEKILNSYGINPHYILTEEISKYYADIDLEKIDKLLYDYSGGSFNLNSAVISDRTLINYTSDEINDLAKRYFFFWKKVFLETRASFIFHEIVTHLYNHIASAMIKQLDGYYFGLVPVFGLEDKNFKFIEYDNGSLHAQLINDKNNINYSEYENAKLIKEYQEKLLNKKIKKNKELNIFKILLIIFFEKYNYIKHRSSFKRQIDPNNYWMIRQNKGKLKLLHKIKLGSSLYHKGEIAEINNYYYFPMHIEPESVLLHWSSGLIDQYSLIEQICRILPINTNLVVKEHWADPCNANIDRLNELNKIHNLIIISPKSNGTDLIKNSLGVISINGTALFEAYILKKKAYMIGNNYYNLCKSIICVDLITLRSILRMKITEDNYDYNFIRIYNETNYVGNIEQYFTSQFNNDQVDNQNIAESFLSLLKKFQ